MPNNSSSVAGEIWELFVLLNQRYFLYEWLCERATNEDVVDGVLFPQKRHSSSGLIPYLNSSPFVTTILWINLNWNSLSFVFLLTVLRDLKIFPQWSSCKERFSLHLLGPVWPLVWPDFVNEQLVSWFRFVQVDPSLLLKRNKKWSLLIKNCLSTESTCLAFNSDWFGIALMI